MSQLTSAHSHRFVSSRIGLLGRAVATVVAVVALAGCDVFDHGDEDLAGLIGTQFVPMTIDQSGVAEGTLKTEAQVAPASFLTAVKEKFGRDFERVELSAVRIKAQNAGVAAWSDIYSGEVSVALIPASQAAAIVVAKGTPPAGTAELAPTVTAGPKALDAFPDIAAGNFRVQVSGATPKGSGDSFSQTVTIELEFLVF